MNNPDSIYQCLNCNRSETEIPLVTLRYNRQQEWICTQCLPIMIHQPEQLTGKLAGFDENTPVSDLKP